MNRSILIVICDFLLVSLLAFSTVDINKVSDNATYRQVNVEIATNQVAESGKDLTAVMRMALDEERKNRDQLMGELTKARDASTEREKQALSLQQALQSRDTEARRLQQEQANLRDQYASAQTNILTLTERLATSSSEALMSREKLAAMEADLRKQSEQAAALQKQLTDLNKSHQAVLSEKQELAGQLKVAETEKRYATEQVVRMREEVKVEREEKAKLAEGVKALASKSGELAQEVRENRPLAPNTIFNEFLTNRVQANFTAFRSGLLGLDTNRRREAETVLVSDGTNTFALFHIQDTPFQFFNPGTDWESLTGSLSRNTTAVPVRSLSFYWQDPRVAMVPVTAAEARQLGSKVYKISNDPFKFQDAVLVGAKDGYYGECRFQIDTSTPEYLKLDRSFLKGLFGKFNPSRGDLVFSKTGELLGVMANGTYCMMIRSFDAAATFDFGKDVRTQHTGEILARFYLVVAEMPLKLQ